MFLIIGIWGGKERIYASFKFFLYTFLGSVLMLVAMVAMFADAGTTDLVLLLDHNFGSETLSVAGFQIIGGAQTLMWLAFFASFAVFTAYVSDCLGFSYTTGLLDVRHCDCLHLSGGFGAKRYEKADCLFISGSYGLCDAWYFCS